MHYPRTLTMIVPANQLPEWRLFLAKTLITISLTLFMLMSFILHVEAQEYRNGEYMWKGYDLTSMGRVDQLLVSPEGKIVAVELLKDGVRLTRFNDKGIASDSAAITPQSGFDEYIEFIGFTGEKLLVVSSYWNPDSREKALFAYYLNEEFESGNSKKLLSLTLRKGETADDLVAVSKNGERLAVVLNRYGKSELSLGYDLEVFDSKFKSIWKTGSNGASPMTAVQSFDIDSKGNVFVVGQGRGDEGNTVIGNFFDAHGNVREVSGDIDGFTLKDALIQIDEENSLFYAVTSFEELKSTSRTMGFLYFQLYAGDSEKQIVQRFNCDEELGEKMNLNSDYKTGPFITDFTLKEMRVKKGETFIFGQVEDEDSDLQANYYSRNILVLKFDQDGNQAWNRVIQKDQHTENDEGMYNGFGVRNSGSGFEVFFNEDNENQYSGEDQIQGKYKVFKGGESHLAWVSISPEGKLVRTIDRESSFSEDKLLHPMTTAEFTGRENTCLMYFSNKEKGVIATLEPKKAR